MPEWLRAVPGFRSATVWKGYVAGLTYVGLFGLLIFGSLAQMVFAASALASIVLATNTWGLRTQVPGFRSQDRIRAAVSWGGLALVGVVSAGMIVSSGERRSLSETERPNSSVIASVETVGALPTEDPRPYDPEAADEHLANADDYLAGGELGLATEEIAQAFAVAPNYPPAAQARQRVQVESTRVARDAQAQATAETQRARAEATTEAQAARAEATAQASAAAASRLDSLGQEFASFLDGANRAAGTRFFVRWSISQEGRRMEITVSDLWYSAPRFQQERLVNVMGDGYASLASKYGITTYPTTSLVDTFGKEVAFKSFLRGAVVN